jgi:F0F1-type ATP synthase assembly protein I
MPFNRPIPESKPQSKAAAGLSGLVEAEKLMQIALLLPSSVGIGWLIGAGLDSWLHQSWIGIAGIVFGGISGLVYVVRMAVSAEKASRPAGKSGDDSTGSDAGSAGNP